MIVVGRQCDEPGCGVGSGQCGLHTVGVGTGLARARVEQLVDKLSVHVCAQSFRRGSWPRLALHGMEMP